MNLSKLHTKITKIRSERDILEYRLLSFKDTMTPYCMREYYFPCGKRNCKCKRGELHGPYWYIIGRINNKSIFKYVRKSHVDRIMAASNSYGQYQKTLAEIRKKNKMISDLFNQTREVLIGDNKKPAQKW